MMLRKILFALGSVAFVLAKSASGNALINYSDLYSECISEYGVINNMSVLSCSNYTEKAASEEMGRMYDELKNKSIDDSPEDAEKLEAAQRSWISYRDLQCELAEKYVGSPMYSVCPMRMVIRRLDELRELLGR